MVCEYVDTIYAPASTSLKHRFDHGGKLAIELEEWHAQLQEGWNGVRFGDVRVTRIDPHWHFEAQIYFGDLHPDRLQVELYADPMNEGGLPHVWSCGGRKRSPAPSMAISFWLIAIHPAAHTSRPHRPFHPEAHVPLEESLILWNSE